jgi:hypothetical protein
LDAIIRFEMRNDGSPASYQFVTCGVKISYRKFASSAVRPLWDSGHSSKRDLAAMVLAD